MHWIQSELETQGHTTRQYSGRGMYGQQCLSVSIDTMSDAFGVMAMLGAASEGQSVPMPRTDSMGKGLVMYWPGIEYTAE